ncbi:uncharacterized protein L201_003950 [Kwoniella dendrophila CBS 6074]|uniref:Uncharacterized protein n=1 Tax=Kwoniella dendrophila CBS 6074 TaxID=1295534 RepID=A0AAX4JUJ9_9TREE
MRFPQFFAIFLATILIFVTLTMAIPTQTTDEIDSYQDQSNIENIESIMEGESRNQIQVESFDGLSNAQRMKRGLPLRKPGHLFNARLGPRAPAESPAVNRLKARDGL